MIQPVANRILVKPIIMHHETKTASGIILASKERPTQNKGEVLAIGPETTLVKVGDIIYYNKHAGMEVHYDNNNHLIMNDGDVLAIITD